MSGSTNMDCIKDAKLESMAENIQELEIKQVRTESILDRIEEKLENQRSSLEKIADTLRHFEKMMGEIVRMEAGLVAGEKHRATMDADLNNLKHSVQRVIANTATLEVEVRELRSDVSSQWHSFEKVQAKNENMHAQVSSLLFVNRMIAALVGLLLAGALPTLFGKIIH
jgi:chromosome segregation ATPase